MSYTPSTVIAVGAAASLSLSDVADLNSTKKEGNHFTLVGLVTMGAGVALALCSIATMAFSDGTIALIAGAIGLLIAPLTIVQRFRLNRMATFREVHNALRAQVNTLTVENQDLLHHTEALEEQTTQLATMESELEARLEQTGLNVNSFVGLTKENATTQKEIQTLQEGDVMRNLLQAIMRSDRGQDFQIDEHEMGLLLMRLNAVPNLCISEDKLRQRFQSMEDTSLDKLFAATKEMLRVEKLQIEAEKKNAKQVGSNGMEPMEMEATTPEIV